MRGTSVYMSIYIMMFLDSVSLPVVVLRDRERERQTLDRERGRGRERGRCVREREPSVFQCPWCFGYDMSIVNAFGHS